MSCRIRDLEVCCEVIGEGKPIVMVHGMGLDHRVLTGCMEPILQRRRENWRRIYFDLPGMGRTQGADWIRNSDDILAMVLAVIDEVTSGEPFLLVGESYGGYLARGVIRERHVDVEGVLLICPLIIAQDEKRDVPPCLVLRRDGSVEEAVDPEKKRFVDEFLANQSDGNWERFREEMLAGFESGDEEFKAKIREAKAYAFTFDVDDLQDPFEKPSLILAGRQDCLVGYRDAWRLLKSYPRASFVVLDLAGHSLQIEQAELFRALVNEWLDRTMSKPIG